MRIFFASHYNPVSAITSKIWYYNLYLPLLDIGHAVIPFRYDLDGHMQDIGKRRKFRKDLETALLQQISQAHAEQKIDLLFSYFDASLVTPQTIRKIRNMGIITVNWYCNASYQFANIAPIAPAYDFSLVPEKFRIQDYKKIGARPIYCQEAANPNIYKPYPLAKELQVSFVGRKYGDRPLLIRRLHDHGIDINVFGAGWREQQQQSRSFFQRLARHSWSSFGSAIKDKLSNRHMPLPQVSLPEHICHEPLPDEEMIKLFSRSRINLGFSSCGNTAFMKQRIQQIRLRDFEVPMSGGFYMVEFMEELLEFFEPEKEIICYRNVDELLEKTRYFLEHEEERTKISQAGHARALADHTWQKRLLSSFAEMGL